MANPAPTNPTPITVDAFIEDRQNMWAGFTSATVWAGGAVVVVLVLMAIFLL
jgi:hypothetical protein